MISKYDVNKLGIINLKELNKNFLVGAGNVKIPFHDNHNNINDFLVYRNEMYILTKHLKRKGKFILCSYEKNMSKYITGLEVISVQDLEQVIREYGGDLCDNFSFEIPNDKVSDFLNVLNNPNKLQKKMNKGSNIKTNIKLETFNNQVLFRWPNKKRKTPHHVGLLDMLTHITSSSDKFLCPGNIEMYRSPIGRIRKKLTGTSGWKGKYVLCTFITKNNNDITGGGYAYNFLDIEFIRVSGFIKILKHFRAKIYDEYSFDIETPDLPRFLSMFSIHDKTVSCKSFSEIKENIYYKFKIIFSFEEWNLFRIYLNVDEINCSRRIKLSDLNEEQVDISVLNEKLRKAFSLFSSMLESRCRNHFIRGSKTGLEIGKDSFIEIIMKLEELEMQDILITTNDSEFKLFKPSLTLNVGLNNGILNKTYLNLNEILDFDWSISVGNKQISYQEFDQLVTVNKRVIELSEGFVYLTKKDTNKFKKDISSGGNLLDNYSVMKLLLGKNYNDNQVIISKNVSDIVSDMFRLKEITAPGKLNGKLRSYQLYGYKWLFSNCMNNFGSLIADDMGLGKTIQVISTILKLIEVNQIKKSTLVICPTSLLENWSNEISKFAPSLTQCIYHGQNRKENRHLFQNRNIIITSYGIISEDLDFFSSLRFDLVVIDEAQNIKNPNTRKSKSIKKIQSKFRIAMSGTPIENRLTELWSIFDFTLPSYLGTVRTFNEKYAQPIEQYEDIEKNKELKKIINPFMLRRLKTDKDIIPDLPEKIIKDEYCYLSVEQATQYEAKIRNIKEQLPEEKKARNSFLLKEIVSLKKICNHPNHYDKACFVKIDNSGKMIRTIEIIEQVLSNNEKIIVFSQFTQMLYILKNLIENKLKLKAPIYDGSMSIKERESIKNAFTNNPDVSVLLISIKAGGTGLNLVQANNVIHYDLWWNPAVEEQATDRTYRIGQKKNVLVHRLIVKNTFEEKINKMLGEKRDLANLSMPKINRMVSDLSDREIEELFSFSSN